MPSKGAIPKLEESKMKEFVTIGYSYNELNETAKECVKQWYLEDETRSQLFTEDIYYYLKENFPQSDLKVCYSLSYCQGDGLNIYGTLYLHDFLNVWNVPDGVKSIMSHYIENSESEFTFENDNHYCYSCKFVDKKYIEDYVEKMCDDLVYNGIKRINTDLVRQFYVDMLDYFEELDRKFEEDGYKYLYEVEDEEIAECCEVNDWYFTKDGKFIA